jgi:hypothetical protein
MKSVKSVLVFLAVCTATLYASEGNSDSLNVSTKPELVFYGRVQLMGSAQSVLDKLRSDKRIYLFLKQARLGLTANIDDVILDFQTAFGGEEIVVAPSPGVSLQLLDYSVDFPILESLRLKVGQYKVPYGREGLTNTGYLLFGDRSVQYNAFLLGRDVGVTLYGSSDALTGALGVFTGGGRDVPIRYLPEKFGFPMITLRLGYNEGYDENVLTLRQTNFNSKPGYAAYVNGLYMRDFIIGHSTILNVKSIDKSLLIDPAWNPYIAAIPFSQGVLWQVGGDAAFRNPINDNWWALGEVELNRGGYENGFGAIFLTGGRIQLAVSRKPFDIGIRYAFFKPDKNFAYVANNSQSYTITDDKLVHELTLGVNYYLKNDRLKVTADLPFLFQVPVMDDPVSGAYILTQQQSQVSYISTGGSVVRKNVVQGRLQLQYMF